jgi:hypothetical protein
MIGLISAAVANPDEPYLITRNRLEAVMTIEFARRRIANQDKKTEEEVEHEALQLLDTLKKELVQVRAVTNEIVTLLILQTAQEEQIEVPGGRQVSRLRDITIAWRDNHQVKGMAEKVWRCLYGVKDNSFSIYEIETNIMQSLGWAYVGDESGKFDWPYSNGCVAHFVTEAFNRIRKLVLNPGKKVHGWTVCLVANRGNKQEQSMGSSVRRTKCVFDAARFLKHKDGKPVSMFGGVRITGKLCPTLSQQSH